VAAIVAKKLIIPAILMISRPFRGRPPAARRYRTPDKIREDRAEIVRSKDLKLIRRGGKFRWFAIAV